MEHDCPICFDKVNENGNFVVTTPCGHAFCFKCITKAMNTNANCPFCRTPLMNEPHQFLEDEDEEEDGEEEDEYISLNSEEDNEDSEHHVVRSDVETIVEKFQERGYTMIDLMSILLERKSRQSNSSNTHERVDKITDELYDLVDELDSQCFELKCMMKEDKTAM